MALRAVATVIERRAPLGVPSVEARRLPVRHDGRRALDSWAPEVIVQRPAAPIVAPPVASLAYHRPADQHLGAFVDTYA